MSKVILKQNADVGQYLVAAEDVSKGTVLVRETSYLTTNMKLNTIQFDCDSHVALAEEGLLWRIQHMCDPNTILVVGDERERSERSGIVTICIVAIRNIRKGDPIGYNYNTTEIELFRFFSCKCGSKQCIGKVGGFSLLNRDQQKNLISKFKVIGVTPAVFAYWKRR